MRFLNVKAAATMLCGLLGAAPLVAPATFESAEEAAVQPEMVSVPATAFWMGDPWGDGLSSEHPFHQVSLSPYHIGKYRVTNAQYAEFLNDMLAEGQIEHAVRQPEGGWYSVAAWWKPRTSFILFQDYTDNVFSQIEYARDLSGFSVRTRDGFSMADHPAVCQSWWGAAAYCNWLSRKQGLEESYTEWGNWPCDFTKNGYHLPTEAQWECAAAWDPTRNDPVARGHWRYGYRDDQFSFSRTNSTGRVDDWQIYSNNPLGLQEQPYTTPVGFFNGINVGRNGPTQDSPSYYGCYDMTGNSWDWCNDWYDANYYSYSPATDPLGPATGSVRGLRGASWYCYPFQSRCSFRWTWDIWVTYHFNGFRVARQELAIPQPAVHITINETDITISWLTVVGRSHLVQYCEDLVLGPWVDLGLPLGSTGNEVQINDPSDSGLRQRFYRIASSP